MGMGGEGWDAGGPMNRYGWEVGFWLGMEAVGVSEGCGGAGVIFLQWDVSG